MNPDSSSPYEDAPHNNPFSDQYQNPHQSATVQTGQSAGEALATDRATRQWATVLHLSQFAGYVIPLGGFLVPIVIWIIKKDESPELDAHGREVMNWLISEFIYLVVSILLLLVVIGIPLLIILGVLGVVFPIIAAVKASDGVLWRYPLTIRFF